MYIISPGKIQPKVHIWHPGLHSPRHPGNSLNAAGHTHVLMQWEMGTDRWHQLSAFCRI